MVWFQIDARYEVCMAYVSVDSFPSCPYQDTKFEYTYTLEDIFLSCAYWDTKFEYTYTCENLGLNSSNTTKFECI